MPPLARRKSAAGAQACILACERYLALCAEASAEKRQHAGDCADLCRLGALLLERRSPWAPAACELAARYALACAERCDGGEPLERECAGACRRFVEACRPLLPT
ncbi:Ferredoxin [Pseudomonas paraeruginosa]|nr:Ferredoxin [Pseudomonas aeruginosa]